jgi:hypothetical protein
MWKHVKVKINVYLSKTRFVSGCKLLTKGGGQLQPMDEDGKGSQWF